MQSATIIVLLCLVAVVVASVHYEQFPAEESLRLLEDSVYDTPALERSPRTKRGLLLLKKKLLLGALGLKAAKIGAVGAGVAGAIALKKQSVPKTRHHVIYGPNGGGITVLLYFCVLFAFNHLGLSGFQPFSGIERRSSQLLWLTQDSSQAIVKFFFGKVL